jgi:hypothetical protein
LIPTGTINTPSRGAPVILGAAKLAEVSPADALGSAVKWKENRPNWAALRKLLAE